MATRRQRPINQVGLPLYGINDKDDAYAINDFEGAYMQNMEIQENVMVSRMGFTSIDDATASGAIINSYEYKISDGTTHFLRQRGAVIEEYNEGTNSWDALTLSVAISATKKVSFATLNDLCIFSNGEDSAMKYDGTTVTTLASNPKADVQIIYQTRLVGFKFSNSRVYFSNRNDPETFDADAFHLIDPNNASLGTGIAELNGQVIIFKEGKKYILSNLTPVSSVDIYPLDGSNSTLSHYSIASTGSSLIFLDYDGWYELRGGITTLLSDHIDITNLNSAKLSDAHAVYFENQYRCFVPSSAISYNDREYIINLNIRTPFQENPYAITMNLINGSCYTIRDNSLYFSDSRPNSGSPATTFGKTYLLGSGLSDDGTSIEGYWITKVYDNGVPFYSKKYKKSHVRLVNYSGLVPYLAYRFSTSGSWSESTITMTDSDYTWIMDDLSEITTWLEDYGWSLEDVTDQFVAIQNVGRPRTIQFRFRSDEDDAQAKWIYTSYRYRVRDKYK